MARHMKSVCLLLLALAAGPGRAEPLPDPTRPPAAYGGESAGGEGTASGPQLQSVLLPREGRPKAIIDGLVVRLGDPVAGGRLVRLTETEAFIKGPEGLRRLQLTPEVEKTTIRENDGAKSPKKTKRSHG